jgi:hypothetical protein
VVVSVGVVKDVFFETRRDVEAVVVGVVGGGRDGAGEHSKDEESRAHNN